MNITFLIGNGFDRNLGLNTTYSDFVNDYKKTIPNTKTLEKFHAYIKGNEELWSAAEIAMGEYTSQFEKGAADKFFECYIDFCEQLALYLKGQMTRIDYDESKDAILKAFAKLNKLVQEFPTQEREILNNLYKNRINEPITFNFICFNYTDTLDQCLSFVKATPTTLSNHRNGTQVLSHTVGQICHVHGTVDKEMVFGVNDISQISKLEIFDCDDGDVYKNMMIKIQANASFLENTDQKANQIIQNSHLVYVYGMSIGETDKLWWDRICNWLKNDGSRHLIVQKYSMPAKSVIQLKYQLAERKARREITRHSSLDSEQKTRIESRIHITSENIFSDIANIAQKLDYKSKEHPTDIGIVEKEKELALV